MDIFINALTNSADTLFSFFSSIVTTPQVTVWEFLKGDTSFIFTTFLGKSVTVNLTIPDGIFDFLRDGIVDIVQVLFTPPTFLWTDYYSIYANVPFYFCFIGFLLNSLIVIALVKVIKLFT